MGSHMWDIFQRFLTIMFFKLTKNFFEEQVTNVQ